MWVRKEVKLRPAAEPIRTLGGSPTSVATPPMLDSSATAINSGSGVSPRISAMRMVMGTIRTTVVTLSRNMDRTTVAPPRINMSSQGFPLDRLPVRMAT